MPKPQMTKKIESIESRSVVYPKLLVNGVEIPEENTVITPKIARDILGWEEVEAKDDGVVPELKALCGKHIRLRNNVCNRPFDTSLCQAWKTETLKNRWRLNGETIIIGKTRKLISGQHRLTGLVLADIEWNGPNKAHWEAYWPNSQPSMKTLVVCGIDETDEVINTVDTGKPRSIADALYRSELFSKYPPRERKDRSRITEYAVRLLWMRTGAKDDAFTPRRTHLETFDFLDRHPHVIKAQNHIYEEDRPIPKADRVGSSQSITKYVSPGYAAGMLYLMGCSTSDVDEYRNADPVSEKKTGWERWDKAMEFWVALADSSRRMPEESDFKPVCIALAELADPETGAGGSMLEKLGVVAKAWELFATNQPIDRDSLQLEYTDRDEDGKKFLCDFPDFGGIDLGNPDKADVDDEPKVSEAEAEANKARIKTELADRLKAKVEERKGRTILEEIADIKDRHGDKILLFKSGRAHVAWGEDAHEVSKVTKIPVRTLTGTARVEIPAKDLDAVLTKLLDAHLRVAHADRGVNDTTVTDVERPTAAAAKPVAPKAPTKPVAQKPTAKPAAKPKAKPPVVPTSTMT